MTTIDQSDFTALRHRMIEADLRGRLVLPLGDANSQNLYRFTKDGERLVSEDLGGFVFVPLVGRYGR